MPYEYQFEQSDMFNPKKQPSVSTYKENHGEEPSIESERARKAFRMDKVKTVRQAIIAYPGRTAGELWYLSRNTFQMSRMKDIYDLRRTLSLMKKCNLAVQGESRKCSIQNVKMFPWYLSNSQMKTGKL